MPKVPKQRSQELGECEVNRVFASPRAGWGHCSTIRPKTFSSRKDKQADGCWRFGVSKMGGELSTSSGFWERGFKYVPDLDQECDGQRSGSPSPWKLCQQLFVWLWTCEFASLHVDSLGWSLGMTVIPMLEHCYEWLRYKVPNTGADRQ